MGRLILDSRATAGDIGLVAAGPADPAPARTHARGAAGPGGIPRDHTDGRADTGALLRTGIYFYRIRTAEGARSGGFVIPR